MSSRAFQPISDYGRIDDYGNQLDPNAVSKRMWANAFFRERWRRLGCCLNILLEFESNTCSAERSAIAIHEDWLIVGTGSAPQQCSKQIHCFRPQGTDSAFPAFSKELHVGGRIEPNCLRTHIQRFLDASSRVV